MLKKTKKCTLENAINKLDGKTRVFINKRQTLFVQNGNMTPFGVPDRPFINDCVNFDRGDYIHIDEVDVMHCAYKHGEFEHIGILTDL